MFNQSTYKKTNITQKKKLKILLEIKNENYSYKLFYLKKYKNKKRSECIMMNLKSPTSGKISVDQLAIGEEGPGVGERYFIFV